MFACLLANQYILLNIINSAKIIVYRVVSHPNSKNILYNSTKINKK